MPWNRVLTGTAAGGAAGLAALAARYAAGAARASRAWTVPVEAALRDLGEVDEVSITPLVERLVPEGSCLHGEPGPRGDLNAETGEISPDWGIHAIHGTPARRLSAYALGEGLSKDRWTPIRDDPACRVLL